MGISKETLAVASVSRNAIFNSASAHQEKMREALG